MNPVPMRGLLAAATILVAISASQAADPADIERRATIAVSGETLAEALPRLGRAAGFGIKCGPNSQDRRIYLFTEDQRLTEIMRQLKRLIPYPPYEALWFRDGSGSVFDEDLAGFRARQKAADRVRRERLQAAREAMQKVHDWAEITDYPTNTAERKEFTKKNGAGAVFKWNTGKWLRIVEMLPRPLQDRALLGQSVRVPVRQLPGSAQQACYEALFGVTPDQTKRRTIDAMQQEKNSHQLAESTLILRPSPGAGSRQVSLSIVFQRGKQAGGDAYPEVLQIPVPSGSNGDVDWAGAYKKERRGPRGPKDMDKIPALQKKVRCPAKNDGEAVAEVLIPAVARVAGMPLLGEFDPCADPPVFDDQRIPRVAYWLLQAKDREMPLWELIETMCEDFDLDWDYEGGWIILRSPRTVLSWAGMVDLSPLPRKDPNGAPAR